MSSDLEAAGAFTILTNELEAAALQEAPELAEAGRRIRGVLAGEGAQLAALSGSGSTFFGVFGDARRARRAQARLEAGGFRAVLGRTLTLDQYRRFWSRSLGREGARRRAR